MKEIWKPVFAFEDTYIISSYGVLKNANTNKVMKLTPDKQGRKRVRLSKNNKAKTRTVASLMAETFLGQRPQGFHVAHLDGNPSNDVLKNLKYVSPKENMSHKAIHGTLMFGENHKRAVLKEKDVLYIKHAYGTNQSTQTALAKKYGVDIKTISLICCGKNWSYLNG